MKVAAIFLGKKNKSGFLTSIKKIMLNMYLAIYLCIFAGIFYVLLNCTSLSEYILLFSTNFRQTNQNKTSIMEMAKGYGIFNEENYHVEEVPEEKEDVIIQANNEKNSTEYDLLDSIAKEYETVNVFSSVPNTTITSENASLQRITVGDSTYLLNYSSKRNIDFNQLFSKNIYLTKKNDRILLYSTHTSETYTNSDKYQFEYSGTMRSLDANYNMLKIAKELNENLLSKGFLSEHNTTPHDYGSYTSAYAKSRTTVEEALNKMGGASLIIDVHRDAIEDLTYRPVTEIKGLQVAQIMLVMGVGYDGEENPYYEDNLAFALQLQRLADQVYPGLFKPMIIRDAIYNQDLSKHSFLVEMGATGNTIDEVLLATRCLANLLNILYKD